MRLRTGTDHTPDDLVAKQPAQHSCKEISQESRLGLPNHASEKYPGHIEEPDAKRKKQNEPSSFEKAKQSDNRNQEVATELDRDCPQRPIDRTGQGVGCEGARVNHAKGAKRRPNHSKTHKPMREIRSSGEMLG